MENLDTIYKAIYFMDVIERLHFVLFMAVFLLAVAIVIYLLAYISEEIESIKKQMFILVPLFFIGVFALTLTPSKQALTAYFAVKGTQATVKYIQDSTSIPEKTKELIDNTFLLLNQKIKDGIEPAKAEK